MKILISVSFRIYVLSFKVVKGGPTRQIHKFLQMHMHWGTDDTKGSEHSINGKFYSAEVIY
jgi:hypothetical protein